MRSKYSVEHLKIVRHRARCLVGCERQRGGLACDILTYDPQQTRASAGRATTAPWLGETDRLHCVKMVDTEPRVSCDGKLRSVDPLSSGPASWAHRNCRYGKSTVPHRAAAPSSSQPGPRSSADILFQLTILMAGKIKCLGKQFILLY